MNNPTLDFYRVACNWLRFDGFDPYNTAPRLLDNMSEARYQREFWSRETFSEFAANQALQVRA